MPADLTTANPAAEHEIHPHHPPIVPIPQNPSIPTRRLARLVNRLPKGQFIRYLCVGVFNTVFGYISFAAFLFLFSHLLPQRFLYLAVVIASLVSTPINITVAYFGYKFFVFRTSGNYLVEWLRCFTVYGLGMLPGLLILSALTSSSKPCSTITALRSWPPSVTCSSSAQHHGALVSILQHASNSKAAAGYIAGAVTMAFTTVSGFVGHRKFSFKPAKSAA